MRGPVGVVGGDRLAGARVDAAGHRPHGDAALHWADADAQVAADAFGIDDIEAPATVLAIADGLVRGVLAGDVAAATLDAQVLVDTRLHHVVEIQVLPVGHIRHGEPDEVVETGVALLV